MRCYRSARGTVVDRENAEEGMAAGALSLRGAHSGTKAPEGRRLSADGLQDPRSHSFLRILPGNFAGLNDNGWRELVVRRREA
ncbi:hypothetical protein [Clostridium sp. AN503]|uniref:hypothetical protein n=1 Tax=Clostridium sp. AN503 TaxID=3160598 RepID=UPI003457928F